MTKIRDLTEEDWKDIADIYSYIGHIYGDETICLDGDFSLDDLKRIVIWFETRLIMEK